MVGVFVLALFGVVLVGLLNARQPGTLGPSLATPTLSVAGTAPSTDQPADPFAFDAERAAAAIAAAEATDVSDIQAGSDRQAAQAIHAELEGAGIDMNGADVSVWPLSADGRTLLILSLTGDSGLVPEDPETFDPATAVDEIATVLVNGSATRDAGVARIAVQFFDVVDGEPVELVLTVAMVDLQAMVNDDVDIADRVLLQITNGEADE